MNKKFLSLIVGALSLSFLVGCGDSESTYTDKTKDSIYGKLVDFKQEGNTLTFKAKPYESKYFSVEGVTNNGAPCQRVGAPDMYGAVTFKTTLVAGQNNLSASFAVNPGVDFVDEFKLNLDEDVFNEIMTNNTKGKKGLDFRKSGVEQMLAPKVYEGGERVDNPSDDFFINYVDGDTTHIASKNLHYTIKIRYLSIDTPESTSEIEEWGLSASYFSKYLYSGDFEKYGSHIKDTFSEDDWDSLQTGGFSTVILVSQDAAINASKMTRDDLNLGSNENGPYAATTDGNQRNLAYVWYATKENPEMSDFRCLNLEMVYQGFSFGIGSQGSTSDYYYRMFDAANLSAKANHRHLYSPDKDPNYYYYEETAPVPLSLEDLYASAVVPETDTENYKIYKNIKYNPEQSSYCDKYTMYKVEGYVSRKVGTSWYMQTQPSYTDAEIAAGKALGIYVFTYAETPIDVGDKVSVVGAVSSYGGTFQMQGISYHTLHADPVRDTKIIGHADEIVPVKISGAKFNELKLPSVLVEVTDNIWFHDFQGKMGTKTLYYCFGGSEEISQQAIPEYPFYNTSNKIVLYAYTGDTDPSSSNIVNVSKIYEKSDVIRVQVDENVLVQYGSETCYSYRFFGGGSYKYNPKGAEYIDYTEGDVNPYADLTVTRTYARKAVKPSVAGHGLVCVSTGYQNTAGTNTKMTAMICSGAAEDIVLSLAK